MSIRTKIFNDINEADKVCRKANAMRLDTHAKIGASLAKTREQLGIPLEELTGFAGLNFDSISHMEQGRARWSKGKLDSYISALEYLHIKHS